MARKFTRIPENTFENLQLNSGILLNKFDPTGVIPVEEADLISATTGGINATCVAEYADMGEDIDNCPKNMMELKTLTGWECKLSTTLLGASKETIKLMLGAADIAEGKITPRSELLETDFTDLWWVGDRADGGMYAIKISNALSDGGFSIQTSDKGKGNFALSVTGHVSIKSQDVVPMEFYVSEA